MTTAQFKIILPEFPRLLLVLLLESHSQSQFLLYELFLWWVAFQLPSVLFQSFQSSIKLQETHNIYKNTIKLDFFILSGWNGPTAGKIDLLPLKDCLFFNREETTVSYQHNGEQLYFSVFILTHHHCTNPNLLLFGKKCLHDISFHKLKPCI